MVSTADYIDRVQDDGFAIVEGVLTPDRVCDLREAIDSLPEGDEIRRRQSVYGVRNLLEVSQPVRELAAAAELRELVTPVLGPASFAVRATFFDKVPDANWKLRWHQDSVIAVRERIETPGFTAWAEKAGVLQVRPPETVLKQMLAIRVHLDDCTLQSGPLRILAGSHTQRWQREEIPRCKSQFHEVTCEVMAGGVLVMRPLVLHASGAAAQPAHRRVIHIEYARGELPGDLEWQRRIQPAANARH